MACEDLKCPLVRSPAVTGVYVAGCPIHDLPPNNIEFPVPLSRRTVVVFVKNTDRDGIQSLPPASQATVLSTPRGTHFLLVGGHHTSQAAYSARHAGPGSGPASTHESAASSATTFAGPAPASTSAADATALVAGTAPVSVTAAAAAIPPTSAITPASISTTAAIVPPAAIAPAPAVVVPAAPGTAGNPLVLPDSDDEAVTGHDSDDEAVTGIPGMPSFSVCDYDPTDDEMEEEISLAEYMARERAAAFGRWSIQDQIDCLGESWDDYLEH